VRSVAAGTYHPSCWAEIVQLDSPFCKRSQKQNLPNPAGLVRWFCSQKVQPLLREIWLPRRRPSKSGLPNLSIPVFQCLLKLTHEFARVGAVNDAVVEAEAEVLHGADRNGVVALGVGNNHWFLFQAANS